MRFPITRDNIYKDDKDDLWLKYLRKKNEYLARVKLLPEAIALIEKYRLDERKELFPMIHHPNMRRHMKGLRNLAGKAVIWSIIWEDIPSEVC